MPEISNVPGWEGPAPDALDFLIADHREIRQWFDEFEGATSLGRKKDVVRRLCSALRTHAIIEEEIFYPAFAAATGNTSLLREAIAEHGEVEALVFQIEAANPSLPEFDAKMRQLARLTGLHVAKEEAQGGMFAEARRSRMDQQSIGVQLLERKRQLVRTSLD